VKTLTVAIVAKLSLRYRVQAIALVLGG